jgi:hypothetical protein
MLTPSAGARDAALDEPVFTVVADQIDDRKCSTRRSSTPWALTGWPPVRTAPQAWLRAEGPCGAVLLPQDTVQDTVSN